MPCERCQGLTVGDHFIDMEDSRKHLWLHAWRCLNCGDVVDPVIMQHRLGHESSPAGFDRRSAGTFDRGYKTFPIGL